MSGLRRKLAANVEDEDNIKKSKVRKVTAKNKELPKVSVLASRKPKGPSKKVTALINDQYDNENKAWKDFELLAQQQAIPVATAKNIVRLFQDDNTIPFICRYRRDLIDNMPPEKMREIKDNFNQICCLQQKAETILKNLEKEKVLTVEIKDDILSAKTLDELEHLYAPFKPASKKSLYERAKALNLEEAAKCLHIGSDEEICIPAFIRPDQQGLESAIAVRNGFKHIISHLLAKNSAVLAELQLLKVKHHIELTSKEIVHKATNKENAKQPQDAHKFEIYFQFSCPVRYIKSHQVLAINRGENLKVLSVKVETPDSLKRDLKRFLEDLFMRQGRPYRTRTELFEESFEEAYTKKLLPLLSRHIRSELTKRAEKESIAIFAANLKQLLLQSTTKGEPILGIDPGFTNGCKLAVISECSEVLDVDVIYPHTKNKDRVAADGEKLARMMRKHKCSLIALGNATACRETEAWLTELFRTSILDAKTVRYCIVSEQGASTYSCSKTAKQEFPDLDVNSISAVSIARRLSDPLCELVKVEPHHLGVGMYQHDINEKQLIESLNEVVMECVSYVGVDINTASVSLLSHVAGLTAKRAENIVKHRQQNGPFKSREDLKRVKFVGEKTFVQCAGFVRIEPLTAGVKDDYNFLDSTWVHPESYGLANKIMRRCDLSNASVGSSRFIEKIKKFAALSSSEALEKEFEQPFERIKSVIEALSRELLRDYRADINVKPMFKQGLTKMCDLKTGTLVTGQISNITAFGCFVDIGVECNGLIHSSKMNGIRTQIGNRVETRVLSVDTSRNRIALNLERVLN